MPAQAKTVRRSTKKAVYIDLALQGGGAHGAYTWGVLDRLLEEPHVVIEGISGTSAGSMNAAVLASGYARAGREGARMALEHFWRRVSDSAFSSPFQRSPSEIIQGKWTLDNSPMFIAFDLVSRFFSPYDLNPGALNPLREILSDCIDFDELTKTAIKLFITATNVHTGRGKVFHNAEITPDVLLASACLPTMFQAIEIDGEAYWDGGFSGNPTISPLVQECTSSDTVLVQINPIERVDIPRTARDILNRINEVAFNATLLKELRMIALLQQATISGSGEGAHWAKMRIHRIASPKMLSLGYSSKLNAEWSFLCMLRNEGRRDADTFMKEHGKDLNKRSTYDLGALL